MRGAALGVLASLLSFAGLAGAAAGDPNLPRAFDRPAVASDAIPSGSLFLRGGRVLDSRRVVTYVDGRGRRHNVYVFLAAVRGGRWACVAKVEIGRGSATGCNRSGRLFSPGDRVTVNLGKFLFGVVARDVGRLELTGTQGKLHRIGITRDGGFLWHCRSYNGCPGVIAELRAYDRAGRIVTTIRPP